MKKLLAAITIAATLIGSGASAFDAEDVSKLKELIELKRTGEPDTTLQDRNEYRELLGGVREAIQIGADLRRVDLRGLQLYNETLIGANLSHANLSGANLSGTNLSDANLSSANLSGANLTDADLSGVIMNGAVLCNTTMPSGGVIYSGC